LTLLIFNLGVLDGIKIVPLTFNVLQQYAIPCAWLPALAVTTPLCFYSYVKYLKAVIAPLILKLLMACKSYLFR